MIHLKQCPICLAELTPCFEVEIDTLRYSTPRTLPPLASLALRGGTGSLSENPERVKGSPVRDNGKMDVSRCVSCKSYIKTPYYDEAELLTIYAHYDVHESDYNPSPGEIDNLIFRLKRIERFIRGKGKLLEIGCGRGFFLREALKRGWSARGIELEGSARENLLPEVRGQVDFIRSEQDFDKIPTSAFDVICSYQTLEHLITPVVSFQHWVRGLKPGGIMVINTPNATSWGAGIHKANWCHQRPKDHFIIFSESALITLCRKQGVKILQRYYGGPPFFYSGIPPRQQSETGQKKVLSSKLSFGIYRRRLLARIIRVVVYYIGLGDNIEVIGKKI